MAAFPRSPKRADLPFKAVARVQIPLGPPTNVQVDPEVSTLAPVSSVVGLRFRARAVHVILSWSAATVYWLLEGQGQDVCADGRVVLIPLIDRQGPREWDFEVGSRRLGE